MNIDPTVSAALSQTKLDSAISTAVAKKSLDVAKEQGQAAVAMIQSAAKTAPGSSSGGGLDVTA